MSEETKPPGPPEPPAVPQADGAGESASPPAVPEPLTLGEAPAKESPEPLPQPAPPPVAASPGAAEAGGRTAKVPRPTLQESQEPVYRQSRGFRLRLDPADLARLRELPGSRGRTDRELGEEFFEKQADRFAQSLAEDVSPPAEVRVVVDPYSRQAFLAIDRTIRSILSF